MADSSHVDSNITTTATDGAGNIIVSVSQSNITESNSVESSITTGGRGEKGDTGDTGPAGVVQSIVAGNNIDIDNTDPTNPVVSVETLTLSDVSDVTASATELNYTDGVTSAIQTQIDGKSSTAHTHVLAAGATDVTSSAAELNILDGATLSTTELNYVDGVTSAIQTQLDGKVDENSSITGATKTKITYDAKGLVTAGADATTADIADSTNKRYVTDAQLTVIGNTSGTNTGDQDLSGYVPTSRTVNGHALTADVTVTKSDVGLGNVDNTSDATKNAATATLTNKTLTNPRVNTIYDTNGNKSLQLNATASAVNYLYVVNGATGNSISFRANGTDTNIPIGMFSKGSGQVQIRSDTNGFILAGDSVASGVNYVGLTNAATGTGPTITSTGSDTNVDLNITAKGTGNLNIPTGTGLSQFNTSDKTTNYERVRHYWSSNVYTISSDVGGTGTVRPIRIISGNATFGINESTQSLVFTRNTPSTVPTLFDLTTAGTGLSGTSSSQYGMRINPTINQSSTAGYTMLLINPTESATGSGAKLLADFQVGGTSKVSIKNDGVIFPVQAATASAPTYVKGGVYFDTTLNKLRVGGASGWETIIST